MSVYIHANKWISHSCWESNWELWTSNVRQEYQTIVLEGNCDLLSKKDKNLFQIKEKFILNKGEIYSK